MDRIPPEMFLAVTAGGAATFILVTMWHARREIGGRVLPLWILAFVHTLLFPLSERFHSCESVAEVLGNLYFWGIPVLFLFGLIYMIALSEHTRMTRHLALSCFIFAANFLVQGLLVFAFVMRCCVD